MEGDPEVVALASKRADLDTNHQLLRGLAASGMLGDTAKSQIDASHIALLQASKAQEADAAAAAKETLQKLPLPSAHISREVESLIGEYVSACEGDDGPLFSSRPKSAQDLLMEIDALVLRAYDLPPRLERELLRFMGDGLKAAFGLPGLVAAPIYYAYLKDELKARALI